MLGYVLAQRFPYLYLLCAVSAVSAIPAVLSFYCLSTLLRCCAILSELTKRGAQSGLLKQERESEIVRLLSQSESGVLSVAQLSRTLSVSEMTIRRDLEALAERGLVQRIHGGAMHVNSALLFERSFVERGREARQAKVAIGRTAARMVHDGQVIILDAGTTTLEVARHLTARHITAVTNALPVASELAAHAEVSAILLGGQVKGPELCTVGPMVTDSLARMSADLLFLSTAGFSSERGLTEPDLREAEVKRAMMKAAKRVCLVAHSSKRGAVYFTQTAPITAIQALITDDGLPDSERRALEEEGIEVIIAPIESSITA